MEEKIKLSVVETERKYVYDPAEDVYGSGEGVVSWGKENDTPKLLANSYEKSATLKACIDQAVSYAIGDDVVVNDEAGKWKEEINRRGMTMKELVEHILYDWYIYGDFAIQIIYNKLGIPVELYPLDVAKCRLNRDRNKVIYNKKGWTKWGTAGERYDRWGFAELDAENPTMIYFHNGTGVRRVYNPAPWAAALDDVLTEIESSRYSLNSVTNGFSARYVLTIPDSANLTDEQKEAINDSVKSHFCGSDAPSNFMLYWGNDEGKTIDVKKIEANEEPEHFQTIRKGAKENIFTAMRMSPLLVGTSVENTNFSTQEFSDSFKLYNRTVAMPIQEMVKKTIDNVTGIKDSIEIIPFSISFE